MYLASRIILVILAGYRIITSFSANTNTEKEFSNTNFSKQQPIWHVLVLSCLTFKIYWIYWAYKNWRDLKLLSIAQLSNNENPIEKCLPNHLSQFANSSPILRTLFMLMPGMNGYMFFTQALGIARIYPRKNSPIHKHPVLISLLLAIFCAGTGILSLLPKAWYLLFLIGVIPIAIVQDWLNQYWISIEEPGLIVRHGFSFIEIVIIILGGLAMGFIVASFILGLN